MDFKNAAYYSHIVCSLTVTTMTENHHWRANFDINKFIKDIVVFQKNNLFLFITFIR